MKKILKCKTCKKDFVIRGGFRYCANLGCIEYNKKFGVKIGVSYKKNEEEE
jgi:hypothetical protein